MNTRETVLSMDEQLHAEVAEATSNDALRDVAERSYALVERAQAPTGLLYDVIQPEVATLLEQSVVGQIGLAVDVHEFAGGSHLPEFNCRAQRARGDFEILFRFFDRNRIGRIVENCDASNFGNRFFEQL